MVLANGEINIIADMEGTTGVKLHNNRQKLRARFDIIKKLGQGTYGKVQLAINKDTGEEVAIKTIKKSKIETEQDLIRIQREIQIMSSVQHPHIIHIYEVFENREKIVLVMEYASGGELYDFLSFKKVLEEPEARRVFRQVASAVFYCHQNMICHRDLKLENILLDERGSAKIADFGLSNVFDERHFLSTFCGSPLYASPEIVRGTPYYGPEVDCWSLGVLLYTLVYGAMPFDGSNFKKLVRQISEGDYYEPNVPSEASSLIRRMLTVDPAKRANIDDICCDIWVDLGEDVPLFDIAKDMCKQMPVRLDYLLALTATAPHPPADLPLPPESAETRDVERNAEGGGGGGENGERWERTAEEGMDMEMAEGETAHRKHKLEPSSSSLIDSNAKLSSRKKKKPHSNEEGDDEDGDGAGEKVEVQNEISKEELDKKSEDTELNEIKQTEEETEGEEQQQEEGATSNESTVAVSKTEPTEETDLEKNSTTKVEPNGSAVKRKPFAVKKAVTSSAVSKLKASTGLESNSKTGIPSSENGSSRVPKLKKSLSIGKEGNGSSNQSSPVGSPDKRKTSLTSSRITDTKKAFEAKASAEKKSLNIAGAKVSSVRKTFESPPTTPEGSKTTKSPLSRKNSNSLEEEDRENVPTAEGKKPLVRQCSRKGVTRTTSPIKTMRTPLGSGQHHNGCVPHEAKMAAALAEQNAKKSSSTSPPKSVQRKSPPTIGTPSSELSAARKNSLSKTPSLTKATSGSVPRRSSAIATTGRTTTTRPRSPVKTMRPPTSVQKPKNVVEVTPTDGDAETMSKSVETSSNLPKVELEDVEATEITLSVNDTEEKEKDTIAKDDPSGRAVVEKRGSIEIAPLSPSSSLACRRKQMEDIDAEDTCSPQIRFIPRDQGQFTLLGVKSEVVFDVGDDVSQHEDAITYEPVEPPVAANSKVESTKKKDVKDEDSNKIIRYVATVRRHGSEDNDPVAKGPERVTLLNIRRSETGMTVGPESPDSGVDPSGENKSSTPQVWNSQISKTKEISKTSDGIIEEKKSEVEEQTSVNTEQRGYNVYRSKYRSVQKYRSVVEKRDGDDGNVGCASFSEEPSMLDRSDSFSSTGSNDDLEDVFENLTSESLFSSLLSRTRHLMDRLTDGDTYASRWFQSGLIGRRPLGLPSSPTTFFDTPNVSFVRNPINTNWRNYGVSSRDYHNPSEVNYVVEGGGTGNRVRRWRYSRSSARSGDEEEDPAFMSDSTGSTSRLRSGNLQLRARASFNAHTESGGYNNGFGSAPFVSARNSFSSGSGSGSGPTLRQSRYDTFRGHDVDFPTTRREEARSDIISALLHHRNRSLDGRRPHSFYDESDEPWSSQSRNQSGGHEEDKSSSLYGNIRRPQQRDQRYTKSVSKELDEKSDDATGGGLRRPRSVLVLSDPNQEDSVSVSRDYSKSVSKTGNTKKEEEEEFEREHRVIEDEAGRSVTTTRRECKRSVSRSDDDKSCTSSLHVHTSSSSLRRPIKKQTSDEDSGISRQDSGIGSLYDSASVPSTPLSVGSQGRRGILKFARTVSNELESLEEEISRIGLQQHLSQQQQQHHETTNRQNGDETSEGGRRNVSQSEGCSTGTATDGTTTPASDSAETGSVCSDGAGTETSSSTVKASEEESVGERIRRKSFFARFNETSRIPRKGRKSSTGGSPSSSSASLRSELNRSSSLRHRHVFDDDGLGGFIGGGRMHYDSAADFYSSPSRLPHRWSMHLGNGGGLSDTEFLPYDTSPHSPRRGSLQGGAADVLSFLRRPECGSASSWIDDGSSFEMPSSGRSTSPMNRTRSLPEEGNPPSMSGRQVLRQHSTPSSSTGVPPPSPARRPSHLGLYPRNISQSLSPSAGGSFEESGELSSPEASNNCSGLRSSRRPPPTAASSTTNPRMTSSLGDALDGFETNAHHRRPGVGTLASLMDSLDSPSEVLQKAMDLCDSLRYT